MSEKLKPCPFCGSDDITIEGHYVGCSKCGAEQDFPVCEECGEPMDFEESKFSCASCSKEAPVPEHCGEPMAPKIV